MDGQLTVIDLNGCDESLVQDSRALARFGIGLCKAIKMKPYGKPIVERFGKGKLRGYSLVQLIETSSIVVHLDEFENKVFIDIFSCKKFDAEKAKAFSKNYFKAQRAKCRTVFRK